MGDITRKTENSILTSTAKNVPLEAVRSTPYWQHDETRNTYTDSDGNRLTAVNGTKTLRDPDGNLLKAPASYSSATIQCSNGVTIPNAQETREKADAEMARWPVLERLATNIFGGAESDHAPKTPNPIEVACNNAAPTPKR